jgi:Collagen triple helix repeat (20 copies)
MMLSAIRKRLTYANVAVTLALVFAMSGGAYAASRYVITSTKQIKPSVLAQLKGKPGASGAQGPAGSAGPAGPVGSAGAKGEAGASGTNGTDGKEGVSVTSSVEPAGANCKAGGSKFVAANGTTYACNGEKGKEGTFGGQSLPAGKTLTGVYATVAFVEAGGFPHSATTAVSFAMPVPGEPTAHYIKVGEALPEGCKGNANEPGAEEGNLCVFSGGEENVGSGFVQTKGSSISTIGVQIAGLAIAKGNVSINGSWAVTAG